MSTSCDARRVVSAVHAATGDDGTQPAIAAALNGTIGCEQLAPVDDWM